MSIHTAMQDMKQYAEKFLGWLEKHFPKGDVEDQTQNPTSTIVTDTAKSDQVQHGQPDSKAPPSDPPMAK